MNELRCGLMLSRSGAEKASNSSLQQSVRFASRCWARTLAVLPNDRNCPMKYLRVHKRWRGIAAGQVIHFICWWLFAIVFWDYKFGWLTHGLRAPITPIQESLFYIQPPANLYWLTGAILAFVILTALCYWAIKRGSGLAIILSQQYSHFGFITGNTAMLI